MRRAFFSAVKNGITYSAEAQAAFAAIEGSGDTLSTSEKLAVSRFVDREVSRGNWSKIKTFVAFAGLSTQAKSLRDWKGLQHSSNTTSTPWAQSTGFTTNGTTGYIRTGFVPSTRFSSSTNACFGIAIKSFLSSTSANASLIGSYGSSVNNQMMIKTDTSLVRVQLGSVGHVLGGMGAIQNNSQYCVSRVDNSYVRPRVNGQYSNTENVSSTLTALSDAELWIGGRNNNGTLSLPSSAQFTYWFACDETGFDHAGFYFDVTMLMMELGVLTQKKYYKNGKLPTLASNEIGLVFMFGQSNSEGAALNTKLDQALTTTYNTGIGHRVNFLPGNPLMVSNIELGVNNNYSGNTVHGAEMRLAKVLADAQPNKWIIVKYAIGGRKLKQDPANEDWNPASISDLYDNYINYFVQPAISYITGTLGKVPVPIIVDWMQGEADAINDDSTYNSDLRSLIGNFTSDLVSFGCSTDRLTFVIGRISNANTGTYKSGVRTAQQVVGDNYNIDNPSANFAVTWLDNDDLTAWDNLHFNSEGQSIRAIRLLQTISK